VRTLGTQCLLTQVGFLTKDLDADYKMLRHIRSLSYTKINSRSKGMQIKNFDKILNHPIFTR